MNALPSPNGLVAPALINMADKGFELPNLASMQKAAMRHAAQVVSHRTQKGLSTTAAQLRDIVDTHIAGGEQVRRNGSRGNVLPAHIANYISHNRHRNEASPAMMLSEADSLTSIDLSAPEFTKASKDAVSIWMARRINAIRQYAAQFELTTPNFSKALLSRINEIEAAFPDQQALKMAQETIAQVARENEAIDDDDDDDEQNQEYTSFRQ